MICPFCSHKETKVIDKRDFDYSTKRRRECIKCERRFNTIESTAKSNIRVIKKDGRRESFDPDKIRRGIVHSCEKRPVTSAQIDKIVFNVDEKLRKEGKEVKSSLIGELVSRELKKLDKVAYIRFASIYKDFTDIDDFKKEIRGLVRK